MNFKTLEIIKNLDNQFKTGYNLPILKGYVAVSKRGIEKLINDIYCNLPEDIKKARQFLKTRDFELEQIYKNRNTQTGENIYDILKTIETTMETTLIVIKYSIVSIKEIEQVINQLYETLPEEIKVAEKMK